MPANKSDDSSRRSAAISVAVDPEMKKKAAVDKNNEPEEPPQVAKIPNATTTMPAKGDEFRRSATISIVVGPETKKKKAAAVNSVNEPEELPQMANTTSITTNKTS